MEARGVFYLFKYKWVDWFSFPYGGCEFQMVIVIGFGGGGGGG